MKIRIQGTISSTPAFVVYDNVGAVPRVGDRFNFPFSVDGGTGGSVDSVEWGLEAVPLEGRNGTELVQDVYGSPALEMTATVLVAVD